jgi:hypothetical protein
MQGVRITEKLLKEEEKATDHIMEETIEEVISKLK